MARIPIVVLDSIVPRLLSVFVKPIAVTIWPFIFVRGPTLDEAVLRHETIHIRQYTETLAVGFLLLYAWDFVVGLWRYGNFRKAYQRIRFEQEAYAHDGEDGYEDRRRRWAWRDHTV